MKLARPVPMWQQVADHMRAEILNGTYKAGQPLPSEEALAAEFGVSRPTIREGIKTLVAEGLVAVSRPRGTVVRDPLGRPARSEEHTAASVREGNGWTDVGEPSFYRANATADQADLLGIPAGEPLLVRAAIQQSDGMRRASRLYVPFSVAEHTPWADNPHVPSANDFYQHFAHEGTLTWTEHVRARMPIGDEALDLEVPPGVPLLIVLRLVGITREEGRSETIVSLEEIHHSAHQIELAYALD